MGKNPLGNLGSEQAQLKEMLAPTIQLAYVPKPKEPSGSTVFDLVRYRYLQYANMAQSPGMREAQARVRREEALLSAPIDSLAQSMLCRGMMLAELEDRAYEEGKRS